MVSLSTQAMPAQHKFSGKRITLDVKDADITNVLRLLADVSKLNIIASDDVQGKVTIKLRNVPWIRRSTSSSNRRTLIRSAAATLFAWRRPRSSSASAKPGCGARGAGQDGADDGQDPGRQLRRRSRDAAAGAEGVVDPRTASVDTRTNVIIVEDIKESLIQAERLCARSTPRPRRC